MVFWAAAMKDAVATHNDASLRVGGRRALSLLSLQLQAIGR